MKKTIKEDAIAILTWNAHGNAVYRLQVTT
jgi:hypothetical protein